MTEKTFVYKQDHLVLINDICPLLKRTRAPEFDILIDPNSENQIVSDPCPTGDKRVVAQVIYKGPPEGKIRLKVACQGCTMQIPFQDVTTVYVDSKT